MAGPLDEKTIENVKGEYWISPFQKIVGLVDDNIPRVQLYEYSSRGVGRGAAAWVAFHYPRTSSIVENAVFDGARTIFTLKKGKCELDLKATESPAGIESVEVIDDVIKITYAGLAGGGVGAARCRGLAENVLGVEVLEAGGGSKVGRAKLALPVMKKVHFGIDDTDTVERGATWSLANEIGWEASKMEGVEYLNHTIIQLYPKAPGKTKNCVSTALTFGVKPEKINELKAFVENRLKEKTDSDETGLAVLEGIEIPEELKEFSDQCRKGVVEHSGIEDKARRLNVELIEITGRNGLIGAFAALGYTENHMKAVELE